MKVGIISDAHHYLDLQGRPAPLAGVARQFEQWAALFDEIVVCAPLLPGLPPAANSPYQVSNIRLLPAHRAGGGSVRAKLGLALALPGWWRTLRRLLDSVDAIHIRCPNNISIVGLLMLRRDRRPHHAVYTGNWQRYRSEPWTYRLQRLALKNWFTGPVFVYGSWPDQPAHIVETFSPSMSDAAWQEEAETARDRVRRVQSGGCAAQLRLLTVGTLDTNKNQALVIHALAELIADGHLVDLRVVGDGPNRPALHALASALNVAHAVRFMGRLDPDSVRVQYRWSDFIVQPSLSEGFSKVAVEAMTHGVVPLLSDLPVNREIVGDGSRGATFSADSSQELLGALRGFLESRPRTIDAIHACRDYAKTRTLEAWREHLRGTLSQHWGQA